MAKARLKPKIVAKDQSQFVSDRGSYKIELIVLHSTESHNYPDSASDINAILGWFSNPGAEVSCDRIVDGDGTTGIANKNAKNKYTWQAGWVNRHSVGIEQIGFASYGFKIWKKRYREEIKECARNIADFSIKFGVPIRKAKVNVGQEAILQSGVTLHRKVSGSGGHHDPGKYPFSLVLLLARRYKKKRLNK